MCLYKNQIHKTIALRISWVKFMQLNEIPCTESNIMLYSTIKKKRRHLANNFKFSLYQFDLVLNNYCFRQATYKDFIMYCKNNKHILLRRSQPFKGHEIAKKEFLKTNELEAKNFIVSPAQLSLSLQT
jgi:hypothetical protein